MCSDKLLWLCRPGPVCSFYTSKRFPTPSKPLQTEKAICRFRFSFWIVFSRLIELSIQIPWYFRSLQRYSSCPLSLLILKRSFSKLSPFGSVWVARSLSQSTFHATHVQQYSQRVKNISFAFPVPCSWQPIYMLYWTLIHVYHLVLRNGTNSRLWSSLISALNFFSWHDT